MYFLKVKPLVNDLRYGAVDDRESSKYLIGTLILQALSSVSSGSSDTIPVHYRWLSFFITSFIIFFGVRACLRVNKEGDDRDFLKRFFCMAFPIGLVISIVLFTISFFFVFIAAWNVSFPLDNSKMNFLIPFLLTGYFLEILKFYWIRDCLKKISRP